MEPCQPTKALLKSVKRAAVEIKQLDAVTPGEYTPHKIAVWIAGCLLISSLLLIFS